MFQDLGYLKKCVFNIYLFLIEINCLREVNINLKYIQFKYILFINQINQLKRQQQKKVQMHKKKELKKYNLLQKFFYPLLLISLAGRAEIVIDFINHQPLVFTYSSFTIDSTYFCRSNKHITANSDTIQFETILTKIPSITYLRHTIVFRSDKMLQPLITAIGDGETAVRNLYYSTYSDCQVQSDQDKYKYIHTMDSPIRFSGPQNKLTIKLYADQLTGAQIYDFKILLDLYYCQEGCYQCSDLLNCSKDSCVPGFTFMSSSYYKANQQICNRNCPQGYYTRFRSEDPIVQDCAVCSIINCLQCGNKNTCIQCIDGYQFDPQQIMCVRACTEGCSNCSQNIQSCTQCISGYTQKTKPNDSTLQYCQKNCSIGQYNFVTNDTTMSQECRSCIANCQSCTKSDDCTNCQTGYGYNSQQQQCAQCYQGCSNCDQNLSCIQCISGYTQTTNPNNNSQQYCKMNCPAGQFTFINWQTMAQQCKPCIANCTSCFQDKQCDTCTVNYEFIQQVYQCKAICQNNQYRDSTLYNCTNCVNNCLQCVDGQSCSQCQSNYEYVSEVNLCLVICNQNQYRNPQNNYLCADCIDNCVSCTNGQSCTTCTQDHEYVSQVNKCLQVCSQNQFRDSTQNYLCKNCHSSCQSCTGPAQSQCSSCYQGWYQLGQYCYQWCPNNYKEDSTLWQCVQCQEYIKPDCQACANTCKSCQYKQSSKCLDCYDSMEMLGSKCVCKNRIDNRDIFYQCSYNKIAVLQATLAIDSPTLIIEFGVALTQIQNFQCNNIFQDSTLQLLGTLPNCSIQDTQIKILLSNDAQIMENDNLSFIPNVLSYQISNNFQIDTFYLTKVKQQRSDTQQPQVTIQFSKTQNTCYDIVFSVADIINDAQRGFKSFTWSIQSSPSLDQNSLQAVDSIVSNANSQKSISLVILKQLIPANTKITAVFQYLLKVNSSQNQQFQTLFIRQKDLIIKLETQSYPIYRFMDLRVYISFYVQICDQSGPIITNEPLNIQINSNSVPKLNQNITQFKYNQTLVLVEKYSIPHQTVFDLNVNASLVSDKQITNLKTQTITPNISDLFIQIVGGQKGIFGFKQPLNLTGLARDFELEDQNQDQQINLKWDCVSLTSNQNDNKCYDYNNHPLILQQNVPTISIPGSTFSPYQSLLFTFTGTKDSRQKLQSTIIILSETDIPILIVKFQDQSQLIQVNINQDIDATLIYGSNVSSDLLSYAGAILYNNLVVGAIKFDYYKVRFRIWDYFVNILPSNAIVQVRFSAYNPYYIMPSLSITNFNINLPPKNCVLSANTSNGQALQTIFQIKMSGCTSANTPISYQFFYYLNDTDYQQEQISPNYILRRQIMDQSLQNEFYTILPSGNLTLMVQAIDNFLAVYNTTISVNIQPFAQNESQINNIIDQALKIDSSQTTSQNILNLCVIGEEISKNYPIYNLDSMNTKKSDLIQLILSQVNSLPNSSLLPTYANKIIAKLQQSITNQQEDQTIPILNQLNTILQNQQSLISQNNMFMNNNNVFLQNLVDSFKVLNSTTQTFSNNLISQQMNISDQICSYLSKATLPNQGGVQLQGNLISLDCQQITSKNLKQVMFDHQDSQATNIYYLGQTTYSRNPFEQTSEFQNYVKKLKQVNSSIIITQNLVIKYSLDLVNASSNRLLYQQGSNFEQMSHMRSYRKLVNIKENQKDNQQNVYMFKFQDLQPSPNNQTCLQMQQSQAWSSHGCNYVKKNSKYFCYCNSTNPTTVTDDLESLLINKNVKEAFSSDGLNNITHFDKFYQYALVWTLCTISLLQFGLYKYGRNLDKKFNKTTISQITSMESEQQNPPISEKNQTPSLQIQSIQEFNGVIQQAKIQDQQGIINSNNQTRRKRQRFINTQTVFKNEKIESKCMDLLKLENQISTKQPSLLKNLENQPLQLEEYVQSEQIQEFKQPNIQYEKLNQGQLIAFQEVQQDNSNKMTVSTFQYQSSKINLVNEDLKLKENEIQTIEKLKKLSLLVQFKVFHAYFNTIYTYEPSLSRAIRFNIIYLRVVHSLCLSTVFDESYNAIQKIIISIVSSIIVEVGVFLITIAHKITRIGQKLSTLFMVCLLLFYIYVILAVISNEEPSYANSKYAQFFLVIGVDFIFVQSMLALFKITILKNSQKNIIFYKLYAIFGLGKVVSSLTI
ncbi:REJ domain protein (macronuclear) [Tetrahymena thermophila SB210]|uniref:REJ domain protein n=1 Tax=Tetrahymena thermophila (strain SB210) TaxID=312017 RepID=I7M9N7_TETTS|nr:REJ domain protein [Tetrahymena thermophila SB210]EAS02184.2 REJ domain protein [Tetrahymena thermophila SB210]|eukprot:XP_001022429.2 REJ domain protein [Tetrahymena thermophila SB210]